MSGTWDIPINIIYRKVFGLEKHSRAIYKVRYVLFKITLARKMAMIRLSLIKSLQYSTNVERS